MRAPRNGEGVHVDDLISIYSDNPTQQADLAQVVELTPYRCRVSVLMAFTEMTRLDWAREAGLPVKSLTDWFSHTCKMPLGAATRLARVVGIEVDRIFAAMIK